MIKTKFLPTGRRGLAVALVLALTTVGGLVVSPGVASAASFASFDAGVFEPGQIKHRWWNNANWDAYAAGLQVTPVDDPDDFCGATVNRTWYQRNPSGEREFHLEIEGDISNRCQVTVWLARLTMYRESSIGVLSPGQSVTPHWNNAHTDQSVYVVGVLPQLTTGTCAMEVNTSYRTQPSGENEFYYRVTNVGSVACSAQLRHVSLPVDQTFSLNKMFADGWLGIFPLFADTTKVVVAGAAPAAVPAGACQFTPDPMIYNRPGDVGLYYHNTGAVSCAMNATFAVL
jgi:hypothetical protein